MIKTVHTSITIVDSVMGKGKSSWAKQRVKDFPGQRFIIVTPTQDEAEGYASAAREHGRELFVPHVEKETSKEYYKNTQDFFKEAVSEGKSIATTHKMLECWTDETLREIKDKDYCLILDEVVELVEPFTGIRFKDYEKILKAGMVYEEHISGNAYKILPAQDDDYFDPDGKLAHDRFMRLVRKGQLYRVNGGFFLWCGSPKAFLVFPEIYILTYMFSGSVMDAWLRHSGLYYSLRSVHMEQLPNGMERRKLGDYVDDGGYSFKNMIRLVDDPKLNKIGNRPLRKNSKDPLTSTWFKEASGEQLKTVADNIRTFFRRCGIPASKAVWSVYKDTMFQVAPQGFRVTDVEFRRKWNQADIEKDGLDDRAKWCCWLPVNARATNAYRDRTAVAFVANIHTFPAIRMFFEQLGMDMDPERYALSEMLQVIWRSAIRDNKAIDLYIPSQRMRELFKKWLENPYFS